MAVDFEKGVITNKTTGDTFAITPFPAFIQEIIQANGLVNYTKKTIMEGQT